MKPGVLAVLLAIVAGLGQAAPTSLPKEVSDFLSRRATCDQWRGEDGYDDESKAEIAWASCRACQGTDAQLASLKRKYRANAKILAELDGLDSKVEPDDKVVARAACRQAGKPK